MKITYPFARVFADSTNRLSAFLCHDARHNNFQSIGDIGNGLVDFCELDFAPALEQTKALATMEVTSANAEKMKSVCWAAVDLFKGQHAYAHFFLNSDLVRNFYTSDRSLPEQADYAYFLFYYYGGLQALYREALELCLSTEVLPEYTLPERFVMFANRHPDIQNQMLRTMYAVAPIRRGQFHAEQLISFDNPAAVDVRKALDGFHRDSENAVSLHPYFAVQSLEEMLHLELMEAVKRGIRVKRCGLCDRYFALTDKRRRNYCDRLYDAKHTCRQIGAKQKFSQSVENDPFLQEFQRIYNRMYSRYYREDASGSDSVTKKLSVEEFKTWTASASELRRAYLRKEISGEELLSRISEDYVATEL